MWVLCCPGDFGTVIVRGAVEMDKTIEGPKVRDPSPALGRIGNTLTSGTGSKSVEPWYCLHQIFLVFDIFGDGEKKLF